MPKEKKSNRKNVTKACGRCKEKKIKCTGEVPCGTCVKKKMNSCENCKNLVTKNTELCCTKCKSESTSSCVYSQGPTRRGPAPRVKENNNFNNNNMISSPPSSQYSLSPGPEIIYNFKEYNNIHIPYFSPYPSPSPPPPPPPPLPLIKNTNIEHYDVFAGGTGIFSDDDNNNNDDDDDDNNNNNNNNKNSNNNNNNDNDNNKNHDLWLLSSSAYTETSNQGLDFTIQELPRSAEEGTKYKDVSQEGNICLGQPLEDSNNDHSGQPLEDSNNDHSGQPLEDSNNDYPGQPLEGSNNDHSGQPLEDSNNDYPCQPLEDSNNDYPCQPQEDSNNDYPCQPQEDSNNDYPCQPQEDSNNDYPCQPQEDNNNYPGKLRVNYDDISKIQNNFNLNQDTYLREHLYLEEGEFVSSESLYALYAYIFI